MYISAKPVSAKHLCILIMNSSLSEAFNLKHFQEVLSFIDDTLTQTQKMRSFISNGID